MKNKKTLLSLMKRIIYVLILVAIVSAAFFIFRWLQGNGSFEAQYTLVSSVAIPFLFYILSLIKKWENPPEKSEPVIIIQNSIVKKTENPLEKAKLVIYIEQASVKYLNESGHYRIQVNIRLGAKNRNICLRNIRLKSSEESEISSIDSAFGKNGEIIALLLPYTEQDLLALDNDSFYKYKKNSKIKEFSVRDLVIQEDSFISATFASDFYSERWPDSWEDLPLNNWKLMVEHGDLEETTAQFSFAVHYTNSTRVVKTEYIGFR